MLQSATFAHHNYPLGPHSTLLFFHLPLKWAFVFTGPWSRKAERSSRRAEIPQVTVFVDIECYTISWLCSRPFKRWMFTRLWAFGWLYHPPASRVVIDDTGVLWGLAALRGKLPVFGQGLPLHTWRSNQNMDANGASRSSFKAERSPSGFDIETAKAFRQLINYCFHRGNHNKWFVSCCLTKSPQGQ